MRSSSYKSILLVSFALLSLGLGCSKKGGDKNTPAKEHELELEVDDVPENKPGEPAKPSPPAGTPAPKAAVYPPPFPNYPANIVVVVNEKSLSFDEPIHVNFESYGYVFWPHIYTFKKSYIGATDNRAWFWWQQGDDVTWSSKWPVISLDLRTRKVLGGLKAGEGQEIGIVKYDDGKFSIELSAEFTADKENQILSFTEIKSAPSSPTECPWAVSALGTGVCDIYKGIYDVLAGIDYSAFGEVGPSIVSDVVSFNTVFKLTKSVWFFKPDVDSIRKEYLLPLIKSIGQLKAVRRADPKNREAYLQLTRSTYSNLIVTAMDSVLKTQRMMPEALPSLGKTGLGAVLGYLEMNKAADYAIAKGQPKWFRELIAPIIREVGALTLDLILNGSNTPLEKRINRFLALEVQLTETVQKICKQSPTVAQNECAEAWKQ